MAELTKTFLSDPTGNELPAIIAVGTQLQIGLSTSNEIIEPVGGDSILNTIKKLLGLDTDYHEFDIDVIAFINSAFFNLRQLGVGPSGGFAIADDSATWHDFTNDESLLTGVKPYIQQKVRLQFDPPSNSFVEASIRKNIEEYEWRLNIQGEGGFSEE